MNDKQIKDWNLGKRELWVSFLNVSLEYHAGVDAGKQSGHSRNIKNSALVLRVKCAIVHCCVRCLPAFNGSQVQWGVEVGDEFDGDEHEWNYQSTMYQPVSHVLRVQFRKMSEKIVILLEDIISSQADTERVVPAFVSSSTFDEDAEVRVWWEVQRDKLKKAMFARQTLVRRQLWRTRTSTLLVAFKMLESLDTSLRDWRSQRYFAERDSKKECVRGCRWKSSRATLWIFKSSTFTINPSTRNSLLASPWTLLR